jgi:hypothetical protein
MESVYRYLNSVLYSLVCDGVVTDSDFLVNLTNK